MTLSETLQIAGWVLTVYGQVQIGRMSRNGFITWIVANLVMIALCMTEGLLWSCGMYATNIVACAWSFQRWSAPEIECNGFRVTSKPKGAFESQGSG